MGTLSGIITNIISSLLYDKMLDKRQKQKAEQFLQNLQEWAIKFEQAHDGTIVTSGVFYGYLQNYKVVENIFAYVTYPKGQEEEEKEYINKLCSQFTKRAQEQETVLSVEDGSLLIKFLREILEQTKNYLWEQVDVSQKYTIYEIRQQQIKTDKITQRILQEKQATQVVQEEYPSEWFKKQNEEQIKNLGNRYLPDINVTLEISDIFDGMDRNEKYIKRLKACVQKYILTIRKVKDDISQNLLIKKIIEEYIDSDRNYLDVEKLLLQIGEVERLLEESVDKLRKKTQTERSEQELDDIQRMYYDLRNAIYECRHLEEYLTSSEVQAANRGNVLIFGEGGIGKSHLLADTICERAKTGKKSLLFLGQHFSGKAIPTEEMMKLLGVQDNIDTFLKKMNQIGEKEKSRILIFIDALNEGNGKKIWNQYLPGIIEKKKNYPWIGIVMSIRTEYVDLLCRDNSLKEELVMTKHTGFLQVKREALRRYFKHYDIKCLEIPFENPEFENPLFLRMFCEAYRGKELDFSKLHIGDVYQNYLLEMNRRICEKCEINERYRIVFEVIQKMVQYKYEKNDENNFAGMEESLQIILAVEEKFHCKTDLLEQLLSEGVLTQNLYYDGNEYLYVTYERLEEYLYAEYLCENTDKIRQEQILYLPGLLNALAIVSVKKEGKEIFQIMDGEQYQVKRAFIESLKWREASQVYPETEHYLDDVIWEDDTLDIDLWEMLIAVSTKKDYWLNADQTVAYILGYSMADRDALFVPLFDEIIQQVDNPIERMLKWCTDIGKEKDVSEETIRLTASMMSMFLISPNRYLRDWTTKALVQLLKGHVPVLLQLLKTFSTADDPYLLERIYAVCFGCAVAETDKSRLEELAETVYTEVFEQEMVYPNILLRDYARNIIDYANYQECELKKIQKEKYTPPYNSCMPLVPTKEEMDMILQKTERKDGWGWKAIRSSMRVEHTRDGKSQYYGDFGRYIFQSYFYSWKDLNANDLADIALKKIYDMGYDEEKHGAYDNRRGTGRTSSNAKERIGKKYQWIALFELAAQVSDHYTMEVNIGDQGEKKRQYCQGSFEPHIRDIDPTISLFKQKTGMERKIHNSLYQFSSEDPLNWLKEENDLPDMGQMVSREWMNRRFLLLNGWYTWDEEEKIGREPYELPQKDLWVMINAYIVKKEHKTAFLKKLKGVDFMGRWVREADENYVLYNKEYYWSAGYQFFRNPYYGGDEWGLLEEYEESKWNLPQMLLPTVQYMTERKGDTLYEDNSASWYKPGKTLFTGMRMHYGTENTVLYDESGTVIAFDSQEFWNEKIGFFVDRKAFLQFLDRNGYSVFWTVLAEKNVIGEDYGRQSYPRSHMSGVYEMNEMGRIHGEKKWYLE